MKEQKVYNSGMMSNETVRVTQRAGALLALEKAKQREAELRAAGKLKKIVTKRGTFWASGRLIEQIEKTDFETIRL